MRKRGKGEVRKGEGVIGGHVLRGGGGAEVSLYM